MNLKKLSIGKAKLVLVSYTESIMKITTKYDSGPHKLYHAHESFPSSPQTPVQLELFTPTPKQAMIDRFSKRHDHPQNLTVFFTIVPPRSGKVIGVNGSLGSDHDTIVKVRRSLSCQLLDRLFPAGTEWGWLCRLNCAGLCLN